MRSLTSTRRTSSYSHLNDGAGIEGGARGQGAADQGRRPALAGHGDLAQAVATETAQAEMMAHPHQAVPTELLLGPRGKRRNPLPPHSPRHRTSKADFSIPPSCSPVSRQMPPNMEAACRKTGNRSAVIFCRHGLGVGPSGSGGGRHGGFAGRLHALRIRQAGGGDRPRGRAAARGRREAGGAAAQGLSDSFAAAA